MLRTKTVLIFILMIALISCVEALTLDESIRLALEHNLGLQIDEENIAIADQTYREARSSIFPQINLSGGLMAERTKLPGSYIPPAFDVTGNLSEEASEDDKMLAGTIDAGFSAFLPEKTSDETSYVGQISLQQPLFLGGQLFNGIRAASIYKQLERDRFELSRQETILETMNLYYQGLLLHEVVEINRESLLLAEAHYDRVVNMYNQGLVSEFDKIRAELEVMSLEPEVQQAENNFRLWLERFRQFVGVENFAGNLSEDIIEPEPLEILLDDALEAGLEQRIELKLARANRDMRELGWKAERGRSIPNVFLSAEVNAFSRRDELDLSPNDFGTSYQLMLGLQMPLFTGFGNSAKTAKAKHEYRQAQLEYFDTEDKIALDIRNAWQQLDFVMANHFSNQKRLSVASQALNIANARYDNQVGINLEVLDAQIGYKGAHLAYLQSTYEVLMAQSRLKKAMGIPLYE